MYKQNQLIESIKRNDDSVLKELYKKHYHKVEIFIVQNNGTPSQAKDIYQEAFLALWKNVHQDKFSPQNKTAIGGYLYQIAKNKWMDYLRSPNYKKNLRFEKFSGALYEDTPFEDERDDMDLQTQNQEQLTQTMNGFNKLGGDCRELLTDFYFSKMTFRAIADKVGITEASARNKKYRCLERLRKLVLNEKEQL